MSAPRSLPHHTATQHAGFRTPRTLLATLLGAVLLLLLSLPDVVQRTLQVTPGDAAVVLGGFAVLSIAAAVAFRSGGFSSRTYQVLNRLESIWAASGSLVLVYRSGGARSIFWAVFIGLVGQAGAFGGFIGFNVTLFISSVLGLVAAFALTGHSADAVMALLLGSFASVTYFTMLQSTLRLTRALDVRALEEAERRELEVLRERTRIARDLHDGLGAELTGLLYRVQSGDLPPSTEVLEERVRACVEQLRTTVWLLRDEERPADAVVAWLRERCVELVSGDCAFMLEVDGELPGPLRGELLFHVARMVLEGVRNASRHAKATRIEVLLRVAPTLQLVVRDDGGGLPEGAWERSEGGLANLRARASATGASCACETSSAGTTLRFAWQAAA